jgi:hypothetical protein
MDFFTESIEESYFGSGKNAGAQEKMWASGRKKCLLKRL